MSDLDDRLIAAHMVDDKSLLVTLYQNAADTAGSPNQAAFFLTHAYVFALEIDHADVSALREQLVEMGCL